MDCGPCIRDHEPTAVFHPRELHTVAGGCLQLISSPTGAPSPEEANPAGPGDTRSMGRWSDWLVGTVLRCCSQQKCMLS